MACAKSFWLAIIVALAHVNCETVKSGKNGSIFHTHSIDKEIISDENWNGRQSNLWVEQKNENFGLHSVENWEDSEQSEFHVQQTVLSEPTNIVSRNIREKPWESSGEKVLWAGEAEKETSKEEDGNDDDENYYCRHRTLLPNWLYKLDTCAACYRYINPALFRNYSTKIPVIPVRYSHLDSLYLIYVLRVSHNQTVSFFLIFEHFSNDIGKKKDDFL